MEREDSSVIVAAAADLVMAMDLEMEAAAVRAAAGQVAVVVAEVVAEKGRTDNSLEDRWKRDTPIMVGVSGHPVKCYQLSPAT